MRMECGFIGKLFFLSDLMFQFFIETFNQVGGVETSLNVLRKVIEDSQTRIGLYRLLWSDCRKRP